MKKPRPAGACRGRTPGPGGTARKKVPPNSGISPGPPEYDIEGHGSPAGRCEGGEPMNGWSDLIDAVALVVKAVVELCEEADR